MEAAIFYFVNFQYRVVSICKDVKFSFSKRSDIDGKKLSKINFAGRRGPFRASRGPPFRKIFEKILTDFTLFVRHHQIPNEITTFSQKYTVFFTSNLNPAGGGV